MSIEGNEGLRNLQEALSRQPKKCTLDTSIWISYLLGGKSVRPLVQMLLQSEEWLVIVSDDIEAEVRDVLQRRKFADRRHGALSLFERSLSFVCRIIEVPNFTGCSDPDDNMVLACGVASDSAAIISGDVAHLISMGSFRNVPILSAAEFQQRFIA